LNNLINIKSCRFNTIFSDATEADWTFFIGCLRAHSSALSRYRSASDGMMGNGHSPCSVPWPQHVEPLSLGRGLRGGLRPLVEPYPARPVAVAVGEPPARLQGLGHWLGGGWKRAWRSKKGVANKTESEFSVVLRHHSEGRPLPRREQWARQG
jgi:hypothetical protein